MKTLPWSGVSSPPINLSSVDFPEPEGPSSVVMAFGRASNETFATAAASLELPKRFTIFSTRTVIARLLRDSRQSAPARAHEPTHHVLLGGWRQPTPRPSSRST